MINLVYVSRLGSCVPVRQCRGEGVRASGSLIGCARSIDVSSPVLTTSLPLLHTYAHAEASTISFLQLCDIPLERYRSVLGACLKAAFLVPIACPYASLTMPELPNEPLPKSLAKLCNCRAKPQYKLYPSEAKDFKKFSASSRTRSGTGRHSEACFPARKPLLPSSEPSCSF